MRFMSIQSIYFYFDVLFFDRYMVTSGMDKKLKVYDIRAFKPLRSYFLPAGASCLSLSQRGLLSAATGDVVQVIRYTLPTLSIVYGPTNVSTCVHLRTHFQFGL